MVVGSGSLACDGKGLAGESARHDINQSLICVGVPVTDECSDIAEDWGIVQNPIGNAGRYHPLAVVVYFHVPNMSPTQKGCT